MIRQEVRDQIESNDGLSLLQQLELLNLVDHWDIRSDETFGPFKESDTLPEGWVCGHMTTDARNSSISPAYTFSDAEMYCVISPRGKITHIFTVYGDMERRTANLHHLAREDEMEYLGKNLRRIRKLKHDIKPEAGSDQVLAMQSIVQDEEKMQEQVRVLYRLINSCKGQSEWLPSKGGAIHE